MVRIERKDSAASKLAIRSLEKEKVKANGKYNTDAVVTALRETFHGKCYLCEGKESYEWEVEHLIPHAGDRELKFDWDNLFWACGHCNHIKGIGYSPILNCTKTDVDEIISFRKIGYFGLEETLSFEMVDKACDSQEVQNTCHLLKRIYYGKTAQEKAGAKIIRHQIRTELTEFKNYVRDYCEANGEDKQDLFLLIRSKLKSNAKFAAFKRWIVRDNQNCRDFIDCWKDKTEDSP